MRRACVSYSCCSLNGLQKDIFHSGESLTLDIIFPVWLKRSESELKGLSSCLLTEAHGKENHSPMVPLETQRTDHLPLWLTALPCLIFWTLMELETHQEKSCILWFLCWPMSPPVVFHCLTVSCPSQIGSCCPPSPGRWGNCFLVPSPYCGEPNASRLLQWHTDNITGELGTLTSAWTLIQWFTVKV